MPIRRCSTPTTPPCSNWRAGRGRPARCGASNGPCCARPATASTRPSRISTIPPPNRRCAATCANGWPPTWPAGRCPPGGCCWTCNGSESRRAAMTFTLKQVETFRTVYETESVTAAARRLDVSPATVSATLAALEASIELRLFERVRQRMQRTPEATLLHEEIRRLNVGLESLGRKIRAIRGAAQPRLRLGCIHAYSGAAVSPAIGRSRARYPDTPLYLQIRDSNTLRDMVVSGELDLALVADESELEGLRGHRLASLRAVAVFPKAHPMARLEQVDLACLAEADVIALNSEDGS